jgi:hypothetical protein
VPSTYSVTPGAGSRVFLYPGSSGEESSWDGPLKVFVDELSASGHEIVFMRTAPLLPCVFADDGGKSYRRAFASATDLVVKEVEASRGKRRQIVGGVSYGGLHAMMAFALTGRFDAWFASLPVTKLEALDELRPLGAVPSFDPFQETDMLRGSTGFIAWSHNDKRVNDRLAADLAQRIDGPGITAVQHASDGHVSTDLQVRVLLGWLAQFR